MIEPIIDRANENISKLLLLDKIISSGAVRNGEVMLTRAGEPVDFMILKYGPGALALAKADFSRTKALADRFQRPELRVYARLLLAHSIIRGLDAPADLCASSVGGPKLIASRLIPLNCNLSSDRVRAKLTPPTKLLQVSVRPGGF